MGNANIYDSLFYKKEIVVLVTEESFKKTAVGINGRVKVGDLISLPIEVKDFIGTPDCKIGCISYNFYFRTPNGVNSKAYKDEKQLEKSVRMTVAKRGFKFVRWDNQ